MDVQGTSGDGHSMLYAALSRKHCECAAVLISEGAELSKSEQKDGLLTALEPEEQYALRNALLKYFVRDHQAVIGYFVSRSRFIGRQRRQRGGRCDGHRSLVIQRR